MSAIQRDREIAAKARDALGRIGIRNHTEDLAHIQTLIAYWKRNEARQPKYDALVDAVRASHTCGGRVATCGNVEVCNALHALDSETADLGLAKP